MFQTGLSVFKSLPRPAFLVSGNIPPDDYPGSPGLPAREPSASSLKHLLQQAVQVPISPGNSPKSLRVSQSVGTRRTARCSSWDPGSMTYFSPHLRLAPGSPRQSGYPAEGPGSLGGRRPRRPGAQRASSGCPRLRCGHWTDSPSTGVPLCPARDSPSPAAGWRRLPRGARPAPSRPVASLLSVSVVDLGPQGRADRLLCASALRVLLAPFGPGNSS